MGYDPAVLRRATARLAQGKESRRRALEDRRRTLYAAVPELRTIDRQLKAAVAQAVGACFQTGTDPADAVAAAKARSLELQRRRAALLGQAGYAEDALSDAPGCPLCKDSGWNGADMCQCLRALYAQEQVKELSTLLDLGEQSFDSFCADWYSPLPWPGESVPPRENMEFIYEMCLSYARKFGAFPIKNLFLTGAPGLGKTFLSACVARTVAESGFSVVYDTAVNIFSKFEEQKFARSVEEGQEGQRSTRRYLNCDLLILDDLGSELTTPFVQSALYTLVNTRLTGRKNTVISSNLSMDDVRSRYNGQTASRLEGEYRTLRFYGQDIRLQKKARL